MKTNPTDPSKTEAAPLPTVIDLIEGDPNSGASILTLFLPWFSFAALFGFIGNRLWLWLSAFAIDGEPIENLQPFSWYSLYFFFGLGLSTLSLTNMMRKSKIDDPADKTFKKPILTFLLIRETGGLLPVFPFYLIYGAVTVVWPVFLLVYISSKRNQKLLKTDSVLSGTILS